jgi:hypothetical protein
MELAQTPKPSETADTNVLHDEATGLELTRPFLILKDVMGDNHYFKDWKSVTKWAQAKDFEERDLAKGE